MYWDPFDELERMHKEMDMMFRRAFGHHEHPLLEHSGTKGKELADARAPVCHMQETENNVIATFELPGVSKGDIELLVDDDHIELKVESKTEKKERHKEGVAIASRKHSFYRCMPLTKEVDSDKAIAKYDNGVLRVEMPKKHKDQKKKKIDIK